MKVGTLILSLVFAVGSSSLLCGQDTYKSFRGLSDTELNTLKGGEALIRQATSYHSLSLSAPGEFPDEIRSRIQGMRANYVGEVIMVVPAGATTTTLDGLARSLSDVQGYVGIPYWSRQNNRTYDLFDRMKIVERSSRRSGQTVVADQHMEPFSEYRARYSYDLSGTELRFRSENLSPISYKGFDAVAPGNMVWFLYGFRQEQATILYGVGAVSTFDMFGLFGDRLKTSFMGRIQAFFSYMYGKRARV